jgi:hypothetical protein
MILLLKTGLCVILPDAAAVVVNLGQQMVLTCSGVSAAVAHWQTLHNYWTINCRQHYM